MLIKWPQLKYPEKKNKDDDLYDNVLFELDENWQYIPDKIAKKDYMRLGKALGIMLTDKNYKWKTYFDSLLQLLDTMFPELRNDSGQNRLHDLRFIFKNAKQVRMEFDSLVSITSIPPNKF